MSGIGLFRTKREGLSHPERLAFAGSVSDGFWLHPPEPRGKSRFTNAVLLLFFLFAVVLLIQWLAVP